MGKVSQKNADIVKQELDDAKNEITKNVASSYYELSFTRKAIALEMESSKLLKSIADVVRTKYSVSSASQQNLLKVELEITKVNDKLDVLTDQESSQLSILNSYLLKPSDSQINVSEDFNIKFLSLTQEKLDSLAKANRPFLKGINIAEEKAALQKSLAGYDYYPNFSLGVQYTQRDKITQTNMNLHDLVSFMVGISLPLNYGGKISAKVEESESMEELYKQQYNSSMQMLDANFGIAISKLITLRKRIDLINNGLLPQAEQTLKAALSSYQVGQIDFINVIDAENNLYKIQTNLYRLKTNYLKEVTSLEFLVGTKL
jgi:outer membrane protein TolC